MSDASEPTDAGDGPEPGDAPETDEAPRSSRRTALRWAVATVVVLVAVVGVRAWSALRPVADDLQAEKLSYKVPTAPHLTPASGEAIYRIDPTRSKVTYGIDENIVGQTAGRATGSTSGIAGDLTLNQDQPALSRVGRIVVDVEQLRSDNNLRDARIRHDFLDSSANPLVQFDTESLTGMPGSITEGQSYDFTIAGRMTVKGKEEPVTWTAHGTRRDDQVTIDATTTVKLSTLGIGPISLVGLVSTGDDVTLDLHLVAVNPAKVPLPEQIAAPDATAPAGSAPSFRTAVAPILAANCASCHATGAMGAHQWTLDTAGDAQKVADGLGTVVKARYMPPWPASTVGVPLEHSKALSQADIDTLVAWSSAGGTLDVPESTPVTATPGPAGPQPRADVTMQMPQAYAGTQANPNDYRCFVLDPGFTSPTFVTGYEVVPEHRAEIHHVQIFHVTAAQVEASHRKDGADGKPGWSCYSGPNLGRATDVDRLKDPAASGGLIAGWVPGQDPSIFPDNSGVLFQPGDAVVFQVHYHYADAPVPDRSTVRIQTEPGTADVKPIEILNPVAPVEIPCLPGETAPLCDRAAAVAEDTRLYGRSIETGLLYLCNKDAAELTKGYTGVASSSCDIKITKPGRIVAVFGHEHTIGKTFRLTVKPDQPDEAILLDIPVWNFDWQMNYQLTTPVHVNAGDTMRMECTWDRRLDPGRTPRYIIFAEGTEDEMCFATYALIPDSGS